MDETSDIVTRLVANGQRVMLKWHRLRAKTGALAFDQQNLIQGLRSGASMEVDLNIHADGGFVVLHDESLGRESTGVGLVQNTTADELRACFLRYADGKVSESPVMLDSDLASEIKKFANHGARVQLDIKQSFSQLGKVKATRLVQVFGPLSAHVIVSTNCKDLLRFVKARAPTIPLGYDPTTVVLEGLRAGDLETMTAAKQFLEPLILDDDGHPYDTVYLNYRLLIALSERGINLVEVIHNMGILVDAWTLDSDDLNSAANIQRLITLGVDQITSNTVPELSAMHANCNLVSPT